MITYAAQGTSAALVTDRFMLLADIPLHEATELWATLSKANTTLENVLSELMRGGISQLRDFALVEHADRTIGGIVTAVRGRGKVYADETLMHGQGISTWVEGSADDVDTVKLSLGESQGDILALPIERGVVQTGELVWSNEEPNEFSVTVTVDREGELPHYSLTRPEKARTEPVDEQTIVRRSIPKWMLRFTNGKVIGIGERVLVGRRPSPMIGAGEQLEPLLSPRREVSANHALLMGQADGVELVDLGSTNGTIVHSTEEESFVIRDGASYLLREGDRVDFGDGHEAECVRATHPRV